MSPSLVKVCINCARDGTFSSIFTVQALSSMIDGEIVYIEIFGIAECRTQCGHCGAKKMKVKKLIIFRCLCLQQLKKIKQKLLFKQMGT